MPGTERERRKRRSSYRPVHRLVGHTTTAVQLHAHCNGLAKHGQWKADTYRGTRPTVCPFACYVTRQLLLALKLQQSENTARALPTNCQHQPARRPAISMAHFRVNLSIGNHLRSLASLHLRHSRLLLLLLLPLLLLIPVLLLPRLHSESRSPDTTTA